MSPNRACRLFIYVLTLLFLIDCSLSTKSKSSSSTANFLQKESQQWSHVSCKSTKKEYIMKLLAKNSMDQLTVCLLKALQASSDAFLWSMLGESFNALGKTKAANTCFKEATKHGGKLSKFIQTWHFIGPFIIGKPEVDGDPLEEWGGVKNVSMFRWEKKFVLYSDWNGINWNELVTSLQLVGVTEWQGWAMGDFFVNEEDVTVVIQCLGVHTVYVDQAMITGDVYRRDQFW